MTHIKNSVIYLVAICVVVFLLERLIGNNSFRIFSLFFPKNEQFGVWQFFTHIFIHGNTIHLAFNMIGLLSFGLPLLVRWGNIRFLVFYTITGLGAGIIYTLANYYQFSSIQQEILSLGYSASDIQALLQSGRVEREIVNALSEDRIREFFSIYHYPTVGASGAIYGILVAFAILHPHAKLMLFFLPIPIKAMYFVPFIIFGDLIFGITRYSVGNIAHFAHIGGALMGGILVVWWEFLSRRQSSSP